jgi:hypothetical protein
VSVRLSVRDRLCRRDVRWSDNGAMTVSDAREARRDGTRRDEIGTETDEQ